ncbi:class I SAM-dependent methyltransferase [candidate division KSB1 bacterium]|nr:class I SAM-dependent methyltransferase [candidate division KSB1 bacterium]
MENVELIDDVLVEPIISYSKRHGLTKLYHPNPKIVLQRMELYRGLKILDVGCGTGVLLYAIAKLIGTCELHGIDVNENAIRRAQKRASAKIEFRVADAARLPFTNDYFDYTICSNAFYYFKNKNRALIEINRVLKPGGRALILEGIGRMDYKQKLDKIMRQSPFIKFSRKFIERTAILQKSYLISAVK